MIPSKDDVISMYNKVSNRVKQYALNMTPLELKVDEATSGEPWGPHGTTMAGVIFSLPNIASSHGSKLHWVKSQGSEIPSVWCATVASTMSLNRQAGLCQA